MTNETDERECVEEQMKTYLTLANVAAAANLWDHLANVIIQTSFKLVM